MTDIEYIKKLRVPTKEKPLRVLMSSCLVGIKCGYDGTANGEYPSALKLLEYDSVKIIKFCPEEFSFEHQEKCVTYIVELDLIYLMVKQKF